jgi:DNA-binding Lrp family transcriptional regulator
MTKSSKEQMQKDVNMVLAELQKNSNKNIDLIAKSVSFSKQKVWRIIKQLEKERFIWGYSAITDVEKQDLEKYILFFKRSSIQFDEKTANEVNLNGVLNDYSKLSITIETSYYIHGEYDWVIIFTAKNIIYAKKFVNLMQDKYPGLIEKLQLARVLYTPRDHYIINPTPLKAKEIV